MIHIGALQRVDWLVHKLTTELHSSYWLDKYANESDSFQNVKEEFVAATSWHRSLQIPDAAVTLDDKDQLFAKVLSQKERVQSSAASVWASVVTDLMHVRVLNSIYEINVGDYVRTIANPLYISVGLEIRNDILKQQLRSRLMPLLIRFGSLFPMNSIATGQLQRGGQEYDS
ncbi:hypothetical protein GH714_032488 [Hevea brasiliensis]|uniref:Uncharacterized protein n=1 Tax=Hevea brasiliensis TaxID=3981 RepID=A0A6A6LHR5_HEVBR|nr:hypothetical protein GH714_032488 [Hevea brasiliensis]